MRTTPDPRPAALRTWEDAARAVAQAQRLEHVANTLQRALDQLLNGTLLDEFNNHSDNGLPEFIDRCGDKYLREQLTRHLTVITAALAARSE